MKIPPKAVHALTWLLGRRGPLTAADAGFLFYLAERRSIFQRGYAILGETPRATLSTSGEDHFRMRRSKRPGYARGMGEMQVAGIVDVMRREIATWATDRPIPTTAITKRLVYNLMCRIMAGISAPEYYDDFITLFEAAFKSILGLYPGRLRQTLAAARPGSARHADRRNHLAVRAGTPRRPPAGRHRPPACHVSQRPVIPA